MHTHTHPPHPTHTESVFREHSFIFHTICYFNGIIFFPLCCLVNPGFECFFCKQSHYFLLMKCYNFHAAKCFVQLCVVAMLLHCKLFDLSLLTKAPSFLYTHNESLKCFLNIYLKYITSNKKISCRFIVETNDAKKH